MFLLLKITSLKIWETMTYILFHTVKPADMWIGEVPDLETQIRILSQ